MAASPTPHVRRLVIAIVGVLVLQVLFVFSFLYPPLHAEPHGVPIGLVIADDAGGRIDEVVVRRLLSGSGRFEVRSYDDEADAESAIGDREVYGAIVVDGTDITALVAPPASVPVAGAVEGLARGAARLLGGEADVDEVVELADADPRGLTFTALLLPIVITSILGAMILRQVIAAAPVRTHVAALVAFALLGGLVASLITVTWLEALPGPMLPVAALLALGIFSVAACASGLIALVGPPGVGLSFLVFLLVGNVASGSASAPELLPAFWRMVGPWLPPGALVTAVRNAAYFDGAALAQPLAVLCAFSAVGVYLLVLGARPGRASAGAAAGTPVTAG